MVHIQSPSPASPRKSRRSDVGLSRDQEIKLRVQEAHHRFKNHLQMVVGLLTMQARRANNPEAVKALLQARNAIMAVAHLNQRLEWDQDGEVDIAALLLDLCHDMELAFGDTGGLTCRVHCDSAHMTAKTAATIALIVCELVVNAAKHAYQDSAGEVRIDLAHSAKGWRLTVADDGPGFRVPTRSSPDHIGWAIIRQLAVSLQGKVRVKNGHGATVSVVFPEPSTSTKSADGHTLI